MPRGRSPRHWRRGCLLLHARQEWATGRESRTGRSTAPSATSRDGVTLVASGGQRSARSAERRFLGGGSLINSIGQLALGGEFIPSARK
eukprot:4529606-Pyramimonas_sp.AAC.1